MTVAALLVPRRADHGPRDALWDYTRHRLWSTFCWPIIEGHDDGPELFNRSKAMNRAYAATPEYADVMVIIDADVLIDPDAVRAAALEADRAGAMVIPFTAWNGLTETGTEQIIDGFAGDWKPLTRSRYYDSVSACVAVPRRLWETVGGFDERFSGWGLEDSAFELACTTLGAKTIRMPGDIWHLYHPRSHEARERERDANRVFFRPYETARGKAAMRTLIEHLQTEGHIPS